MSNPLDKASTYSRFVARNGVKVSKPNVMSLYLKRQYIFKYIGKKLPLMADDDLRAIIGERDEPYKGIVDHYLYKIKDRRVSEIYDYCVNEDITKAIFAIVPQRYKKKKTLITFIKECKETGVEYETKDDLVRQIQNICDTDDFSTQDVLKLINRLVLILDEKGNAELLNGEWTNHL